MSHRENLSYSFNRNIINVTRDDISKQTATSISCLSSAFNALYGHLNALTLFSLQFNPFIYNRFVIRGFNFDYTTFFCLLWVAHTQPLHIHSTLGLFVLSTGCFYIRWQLMYITYTINNNNNIDGPKNFHCESKTKWSPDLNKLTIYKSVIFRFQLRKSLNHIQRVHQQFWLTNIKKYNRLNRCFVSHSKISTFWYLRSYGLWVCVCGIWLLY